MVLISSEETIQKQEISLLALLETAGAICVGALLVPLLGWTHILVSAILAPFLLLRGDDTTLDIFKTTERWAHVTNNIHAIGLVGFLIVPIPWLIGVFLTATPLTAEFFAKCFFAWSVAVTIYGTFGATAQVAIASAIIKSGYILQNLFYHPLRTITNIPENWRRIVLLTDSAVGPEFIPGISKYGENSDSLQMYTSAFQWRMINEGRSVASAASPRMRMLVFYLVGISYRWSLKSTALVWSPLIWAFRPIRDIDDLTHYADGVVNLGTSKIARTYSAIVLALSVLKIYLLLFYVSLKAVLEKIPGWHLAAHYVFPESVALWQVAAATNAVLTWWLYIRATDYLHKRPEEKHASTQGLTTFFRTVFIVRNLISIYGSLCVLWISATLVTKVPLPRPRLIIFPW